MIQLIRTLSMAPSVSVLMRFDCIYKVGDRPGAGKHLKNTSQNDLTDRLTSKLMCVHKERREPKCRKAVPNDHRPALF